MLKKTLALCASTLLFGSGCAALLNALKPPSTTDVPYAPMTHSGEVPLWPAVMHAAVKGKYFCEDTNLNVLGDVYRFKRCPAQGSNRIRFDLIVERKGDKVGVELEPEWRDGQTGEWKPGLPPLAMGNTDSARSQFVLDMREALDDKERYASVKAKYYEDLAFHISVMEDMTTVGKKAWIKRLRESNTRFKSEASLGDVDEVEKSNERSKKFTYRVFLKLDKPGSVAFVITKNALILYTKDDALVSRQKGERVSFEGSIVDYDEFGGGNYFIMEQ